MNLSKHLAHNLPCSKHSFIWVYIKNFYNAFTIACATCRHVTCASWMSLAPVGMSLAPVWLNAERASQVVHNGSIKKDYV